jgi:hypothetical protein
MSGADPLAAISARVAAAEAAMLEAAINLGVSAEILQAQISVGDILAAKILPPQNGQDLIEILGQQVAAQLPPGVHPGETLLLQVTGFAGTQIYVQNLGAPDPRNPLPVAQVVLPAAEDPAPQSAVLTTIRTAEPQPELSQAAQPQPPPVSPPREVFVAASVRQAQSAPVQTPGAQPPPPAASVHGVEARIAAAQAAKIPPATISRPTGDVPRPAHSAQPEKAPIPPIVPQRSAQAQTVQTARTIVQRAVQTVSEFLRAARLPDTPFTRMAATIAPQAPERLPSVLQRLETALPLHTQDERISTLRTLIGFTARLNPANPETLRAQISSYVSNVVEGVEAKLAQLLQAHTQTQTQIPQMQTTQTAPAHGETSPLQRSAAQQPATQGAPQPAVDDAPLSPTAAQARVAERSAAISHDLKSVVLSLLRDPPADRTPAMTQALNETLITLTGAQVNTLSANQQNPGTFTLTLPVYYHEGGKPAQIRISRDAQSRAAKLDADNFHVAFVLDTAHLGTVAVDLQTTGRTVKVDVKTEHKASADRFSDTLSSLRTRLEDLRYRVSSAVASALPSPAKPEVNVTPGKTNGAHLEKKRGLDLQA